MIKALALTGPTASGKTAVSLRLAEELGCEIISCDSMQIYKGMDIGTAKATAEEQRKIPHHLIDIVSPDECYSTERYRKEALTCAEEICSRGAVPMFVGGTGLYIDTVMRPSANVSPESDPKYRNEILAGIKTDEDKEKLWKRLYEVDPYTAESVHKNNVKRVIRALEIYDKTGIPKSTLDKQVLLGEADIDVGMITLDFHDRENLYRRVDIRVDQMIKEGLFQEVKSLFDRGLLAESYTASQAIGYKELVSVLRNECSLEEAVETIKLSTRRYAKRQLTWFRHERDAHRIFLDFEDGKMRDIDGVIAEASEFCKQFLTK